MADFAAAARRSLGYLLSLPERIIRSLAALVGGTSLLLTETLFPEPLRRTTIFRLLIADMQQYVVQQLAQMEQHRPAPLSGPPVEDYVPRKLLGTAVEAAGLLTIHMSPLWVFALAADVAGGSRIFLHRLVAQLQAQGIINERTTPTDLTELLDSLQHASQRSLVFIDTPPLSRAQLAVLAAELRANYAQVFASTNNLLPTLESLWQRMERTAVREGIPLRVLSGIMTIDVAAWGQKSLGLALAVGQTSSALLDEKVLASYAATLDGIGQEGVGRYVRRQLAPFYRQALDHFRGDRQSWTERTLNK